VVAIAKLPLEAGLREEREALTRALRIQSLLRQGKDTPWGAELDELMTYLREDLEAHFREEELLVFPRLMQRGLSDEVIDAIHQHENVRALRAKLEAALRQRVDSDVRSGLAQLADALTSHVRFEADLLYFGATEAELAEFRADLDAYYRGHETGVQVAKACR
jgi:iron-sulfur cluster repair protein YtfE (RIC family)